MARSTKKHKVSASVVQSARQRLLKNKTLAQRDVKTPLKILDDVYPRSVPSKSSLVEYFILGVGLGILVVLILLMFG